MLKKDIEKVIGYGLSNGAEFIDLFFEKKTDYNINLVADKIEKSEKNFLDGVGIRLFQDGTSFYSWTNDKSVDNLINVINKLLVRKEKIEVGFELNELKTGSILNDKTIYLKDVDNSFIKNKLFDINNEARSFDKQVNQVDVVFKYCEQDVIIANSHSNYVTEKRLRTAVYCIVHVLDGDKKESAISRHGITGGLELFDTAAVKDLARKACTRAIDLLDAITIKGGKMPVIIGNGFGSTIFHEACGHSLEATVVAKGLSVFTDKLGEKIASDKVTLIDDGTIDGLSGSSFFDDDGQKCQKNILIENGFIKNFMIDTVNSFIMSMKQTGCSRREDYKFLTTSRMTNTYLAPGNDSITDMIKSIDYGIYAFDLSGGSVKTETGDFNFGVSYAKLIENGKITKTVKGVSLIGNGKNILKEVEMVSDDLVFELGYCGSSSGNVDVTCGQPTIKVSELLVGGEE